MNFTVDQALRQAIDAHKANHLTEAERLYRAILQIQPRHPDANHNLAVLRRGVGKPEEVLSLFKAALDSDPNQSQFWVSYINELVNTGELDTARAVLKEGRTIEVLGPVLDRLEKKLDFTERPSLEIRINELFTAYQNCQITTAQKIGEDLVIKFPEQSILWKLLGEIYAQKKMLGAAANAMQKSLELMPNDASTFNNLGNVLKDLDRIEEALESYRASVRLNPNLVQAWINAGSLLRILGEHNEAECMLRKAVNINPEFGLSHANLGHLLCDVGRFSEAEYHYLESIRLAPSSSEPLLGLSSLQSFRGNYPSALSLAVKALNLDSSHKSKLMVVNSLKYFNVTQFTSDLVMLITGALEGAWARPALLVPIAQDLLIEHPTFKKIMAQAANNTGCYDFPALFSLLDSDYSFKRLLHCTLVSAPLSSMELEHFVVSLRRYFLKYLDTEEEKFIHSSQALQLLSAVAQQCFINEYIFHSSDDETALVHLILSRVLKKFEAQVPICEISILILASYVPLFNIPGCEFLLEATEVTFIEGVLTQQIREPLLEQAIRPTIPQITEIDDLISRVVQEQYEQNPYPRWVQLPKIVDKTSLNMRLRSMFPRADFIPLSLNYPPSILIAGCGTGQHAIEVFQLYLSCSMLAIDLSISSLAYAKRKAYEAGIKTIEFAQGDILQLGRIGRSFDVIESSGVLHHMSDPFMAWDKLIALLKVNGFMKIGLYSSIARRHIVKLRDIIAAERIESTHSGIVAFRENFFKNFKTEDYGWVASSSDFYSTSACRDLLFHVHERRMDLLTIQEYLHRRGLKFLGFEIDQNVILSYQRKFPDDSAACNLQQWHLFEQENPDTFKGMYQFWVQKL